MKELPSHRSFEFCGLGIIHVRLWRILEVFSPPVAIGDVFDEYEQILPEYITFYGPNPIRIRGQGGSTCRICTLCGRVMYNVEGDPYILRRDLQDRHVFFDGIWRLFVDEQVKEAVDWTLFDDFKLEPYPIVDEPVDGLCLPDDPGWSSSDKQDNTYKPYAIRLLDRQENADTPLPPLKPCPEFAREELPDQWQDFQQLEVTLERLRMPHAGRYHRRIADILDYLHAEIGESLTQQQLKLVRTAQVYDSKVWLLRYSPEGNQGGYLLLVERVDGSMIIGCEPLIPELTPEQFIIWYYHQLIK